MQVLEITRSKITLKLNKGFILIKGDDFEEKHPLQLIEIILLNSFGASVSSPLLVKLCELGIPLIICGNNYLPIGIMNSYSQNLFRKSRIEVQLALSETYKNNLWKTVVIAKIKNQALLLKHLQKPTGTMTDIAKKVTSGDKTNCEAQAARIYWQNLFGKGFRRDPELEGINSFLNYAYAILRAAFSRQIAAKGLLPEIGIHHSNKLNAFCLADDLMEPFRPFADGIVYKLYHAQAERLGPKEKRKIIALLDSAITFEGKQSTVYNSIAICVQKLVDSYETKKNTLKFPNPTLEWVQTDVDDGDV